MQPRLDGSDRDVEGHCDVGQRHPDVVVKDDDGPALLIQLAKNVVDQLPVGVLRGAVRHGRRVKRRELDLYHAPMPLPDLIQAGINGESVEPGVEPVGISKLPEIPPGSDQPLLDRVACELRVPEDEASGPVQPHDGCAGELGEGVMIASPRALD